MTPPAIKTPVYVDDAGEVRIYSADHKYVCTCIDVDSASDLADFINDSARLRAELDEAIRMLGIIALNAKMIPDPAMGCAADIYTVPIDDVAEAARLVARHEGRKG